MILFPLLLLAGLAGGAEWFTSQGHHCVTRCRTTWQLGKEVFACPIVDGRRQEVTAGSSSGGRPGYNTGSIRVGEDGPWDYCTPYDLQEEEEEEDWDHSGDHDHSSHSSRSHGGNSTHSHGNSSASQGNRNYSRRNSTESGWPDVHSTNRTNGTWGSWDRKKRESGQGFNPGDDYSSLPSSLPGSFCTGACWNRNNSAGYMCSVQGHRDFYCSPSRPLERNQVSSINKLWCIGECVKEYTQDHFMCRTMLGEDRCSVQEGLSSRGNRCIGPCQIDTDKSNHYHCQVGPDVWDTCGAWIHDGHNSLEFTHEGQICASPCSTVDDTDICSYVEWEKTGNMFGLIVKEGECGTDWMIVGLIVGILVGLLVLGAIIGLAAKLCSPYTRANTQ